MILFENVTKTYQRGSAPALDDLTIEFERGEFAFLVGASGSGKSTMMRLILKETNPTSGTLYVAGKDLSRIPSWKVPHLRREIGMVFQDFRLLPSKTAYQNIEFALQVIGTPRSAARKLVPEMLDMVGLADKGKRLPHELSGGEQQRVAIARAYVNRPTILLADEPTGNLDPETAKGIMELLDEINSNGTTVLMATHDERAVNRMKKRVVELVDGLVVRDQTDGTYRSSGDVSVISGAIPDGGGEEVINVNDANASSASSDARPPHESRRTGAQDLSSVPTETRHGDHAAREGGSTAYVGDRAEDVEDEIFSEREDGRVGDVDEAFAPDGFDDTEQEDYR